VDFFNEYLAQAFFFFFPLALLQFIFLFIQRWRFQLSSFPILRGYFWLQGTKVERSEGFLQVKLMFWLVPFKRLFCFSFDCWLLQTWCVERHLCFCLHISFETWPLFAFFWKHVLLSKRCCHESYTSVRYTGNRLHPYFRQVLNSGGIGTLSLSLLFDSYLGFTQCVK